MVVVVGGRRKVVCKVSTNFAAVFFTTSNPLFMSHTDQGRSERGEMGSLSAVQEIKGPVETMFRFILPVVLVQTTNSNKSMDNSHFFLPNLKGIQVKDKISHTTGSTESLNGLDERCDEKQNNG